MPNQSCGWKLEQLMNSIEIEFMVSLCLQLDISGRFVVSQL